MSTESYPLHWPAGWPRTPSHRRRTSQFKMTPHEATIGLFKEAKRIGGQNIVISTNVELRQDGLPYANRRTPADPGVAVYFTKAQPGSREQKTYVFACDRFPSVAENMRAIEKTIDALRGIERWGASDMMERAFSGFEALPPPGGRPPHWREVLGVFSPFTLGDCERAYRAKAINAHPDNGGSHEAMTVLNAAIVAARAHFAAHG